jgi:uncharacterized cupin superfamily protein
MAKSSDKGGLMTDVSNIFGSDWDVERGPVRMLNLGRHLGGELLGATVFEAQPGAPGLYHFHYANEEWLLVLSGTPTLRTPNGEVELSPGATVIFRRGPEGAHAISNPSRDPARWVIFSTMNHPDVGEYPDAVAVGVIVGDAPTPGRDAPFEGFFRRDAGVPYEEIIGTAR